MENLVMSAFEVTDSFKGKKAFITGHTGFKGSWLTEWLIALGAEVTGYALQPPTQPALFEQLGLANRIRHIEADIRNRSSVERAIADCKPDFVFHLAAQPLVRLSYAQPVETYETNVIGTINVLEALRGLDRHCAAIMVTTDKCYENREWNHGYREEDSLGGHDPYSSSKAACEIAISSWRRSFFQMHPVKIASVRAGNVIGGGDWATNRIVPDCIRALQLGKEIPVRNKTATRPWQHVLEPLSGYLTLAAMLSSKQSSESLCSAFNFGPALSSNRTVADIAQEVTLLWPGTWVDQSDPKAPHEAGKLNLATDKAFHILGWNPSWNFETSIAKTVMWYRDLHEGADPVELTRSQIKEYTKLFSKSLH
jgi:CDP-glucose 4,6-dehydratase